MGPYFGWAWGGVGWLLAVEGGERGEGDGMGAAGEGRGGLPMRRTRPRLRVCSGVSCRYGEWKGGSRALAVFL